MSTALERFIAYQAEYVGHADEDARLEWECMIAEMQAENAKLLEELEAAKHDLQVFSKSAVEMDAENAKLRELVRVMWSYINAPVNQRNSLKERLAIYDDLADRMAQLGVEVD